MVPDRRLCSGTWDKIRYAPGERAALAVAGRHLGREPLLLVVEAETAPGTFVEVARVPAEVASDEASAEAAFTFPAPPSVQTAGQLLGGRFAPDRFGPGAEVELQVEASGLAGEAATLEVERELPGGAWERVATLEVALGDGGVRARLPLEVAPPTAPAPASCSFGALEGTSAWLRASAPGLEGAALQFVLEREDGAGRFVEVGQAVATVRAGEAQASVPLPSGDG